MGIGPAPRVGKDQKMTKLFQIENTASGIVLGSYEAETAAAALDLMAQDAGYADYAEACEAAPSTEGEIVVTEI